MVNVNNAFDVKNMGAECKIVDMDKFEKIQVLNQQLHVKGGVKDVNDSR